MNYNEIGEGIGALVSAKQEEYGNAFIKAGEILKILYPVHVPIKDYTHMLAIARITDKLCRISNSNNIDIISEAYKDIAGYGLLGYSNSTVTEKLLECQLKDEAQRV